MRTARALRARGAGPGRTVTLLAGNLPETIAARCAAHLLGCRVVRFHGDAPVRMRAGLVRDAETHVLVADPRSAAGAAALAATAGAADLVTLGPAEAGEDLLAAAAREPAEPVPGAARPQDVCLIRPTGGTTGPPKGVCVSYAQAGAWRRAAGPAHRLLVCTPIAHGPGRLADRTLAAGGTVVLHDCFEPGEVLAAVERERITRLYLLLPLLHRLLDHPDLGRRDLASLTSLPYGACRASPARLAEAVRRLGPVLYQIYGQTEAGSISQLDAAEHDVRYPERLRSAGRPLPGVEVAIRDDATVRRIARDREHHVLKGPLDTRGRGVVIGPATGDAQWQEAVERAGAEGWLVQEYLPSPRLRATPDGPAPRHDLALGAVDGRLAAAFVRTGHEERLSVAGSGSLHPLYF
ncbi:AMP-binding protein [Kitasatospora sp. NPDC091335]|uniref:AMP-binding protein n=1 Tax=Kitasatospora sp. NPDC091335 TaxID=3364085 RepID=UPI00382BA60E